MGFVDGTLKKPSADCPKFLAWTKCNSMVLSWILNAFSRELHDSVAYVEGVAEVWEDLKERFSQGNTSWIYELKLELATTTQQTRSVAAYFSKLKPIWDELQAHEPVPTCTCGCTCGATKEFTRARETKKVHQFLMGLNENFSTMRSQILNMEPLPSLNKVYSMTTKEEKQQMVSASRSPTIEATALAAKTSYNEKVSTSGKPHCDNCKRIGHTKERCYEIIGYPVSWKPGQMKMRGKGEQQKHQNTDKDVILVANASLEPQLTGGQLDQSPITGPTKAQYDQLLTLLGGLSLEEVDWNGIETHDTIPLDDNEVDPVENTITNWEINPTTDPAAPVQRPQQERRAPQHLDDYTYLAAISSIDEPKTFSQAIKHEKWREAMRNDITALEKNGTWTIELLPPGKCAIDSKWIHKVKFKLDGIVERYKAKLVAKGFTQIEGLDFHETFAPVAKMASRNWFEKFTNSLLATGFCQSKVDYSLFTSTTDNKFVAVLIYVDDIVITSNDAEKLAALKAYLYKEFSIKDLGPLKYFLGVEVARTAEGIILSQQKYALDILIEAGLLGAKPSHFPLDQHHRLKLASGPLASDSSQYMRLVGRLLYLTITRPDICYSVSILAQFMQNPKQEHFEAAMKLVAYCDADWAGCPHTRRSTTGYYICLGGSPVSWKSKKQSTVSRFSVEAEYRAMASTVSELTWLKSLLFNLGINHSRLMTLFYDNQVALHIANNLVFHERTKHIEIDCHFVREHIQKKELITAHVSSCHQLANLFTKALGRERLAFLLSKFGIRDLHAPT
ncbi:hypothetical protein SLEP1_g55774 [Rubroshorea leprosula]|uniref:Reverse transcriptase Ty1/copia-type domain-containing protein n=1 Tax=Rubroshorea leprosula TaxID=152421 RepID=A0AAV5MGJ2_9ROSI|nr:hypothetical protein SLEP1_g55774 [Rubroshorea leprosula]